MAERKRRADDDTVDAVDAVDDDLDEATDDAPADDDEKPARRSRAKTETKKTETTKKAEVKDAKDAKKKAPKGKSTGKGEKERRPAEGRRGPISRIGRFIREVIAELRKVIWPNRRDLVTYAAVVIVFVAVMLTIVGFLDFGFARATLAVFGSGSK